MGVTLKTVNILQANDKFRDLLKLLDNLVKVSYTGSIEIHFNQGGICKVIKHETIK